MKPWAWILVCQAEAIGGVWLLGGSTFGGYTALACAVFSACAATALAVETPDD